MNEETLGIYVEIEFLDSILNFGQVENKNVLFYIKFVSSVIFVSAFIGPSCLSAGCFHLWNIWFGH